MSEYTETIRKVKVDRKRTTIWLNRYIADGTTEEVQFHIREKIHPDLQEEMNKLLGILIEENQLADTWSNAAVTSVKLEPQGEEGYGVQISAKLELERVISMNSRMIRADEIMIHQNTIKRIIKECQECIQGKRSE